MQFLGTEQKRELLLKQIEDATEIDEAMISLIKACFDLSKLQKLLNDHINHIFTNEDIDKIYLKNLKLNQIFSIDIISVFVSYLTMDEKLTQKKTHTHTHTQKNNMVSRVPTITNNKK